MANNNTTDTLSLGADVEATPSLTTATTTVTRVSLPVHRRLLLASLGLVYGSLATGFSMSAACALKVGYLLQPLANTTIAKPVGDALSDFVTYHRGFFATVFVAPVSKVWEFVDVVRDYMLELQMPAVGDVRQRIRIHNDRVKRVQEQIRGFIAGGATRLCTARPGFLAMSMKQGTYKKQWAGVEVHELRDIIEIREDKQTVRVEPGCNMGRLSRELIKKGWTIQVLPELDELTVGGLISGFGIETSSHKYGLFQHICVSYDLVLPSGELLHCSNEENPDLFAAVPWSHGTIGFLVAAEIKLIPAKRYVRLSYLPCHTIDSGIETLQTASRNSKLDFVESLMYSHTESVVMTGVLTDKVPKGGRVNSIGRWYKPWFFTHVRSFLAREKQGTAFEEYIPLRDYYHRHTKSLFWEMGEIVPFGNQWWYRWFVSWIGTPKMALLKLSTTGKLKVLWETMHVAQDMLVPISETKAALDVFHREFEVYPLWLCPMRILSPPENLLRLHKNQRHENDHHDVCVSTDPDTHPAVVPRGGLVAPQPSEQMYVDIGAYGVPKSKQFHFIESMRRVEEFVRSVQGFQALYADTFMTREEFREMFDHRGYDAVRERLQVGQYLPEIYDKVNQSARA
ncbi:hypothetical protein RI367_007371 [Sorochytrium milnesiophthora]